MIGHLRGRLVSRKPPLLIIDVAGVGYEVEAPMSTFYALPETDGEQRSDGRPGRTRIVT